ncbi:MAG: hypothetical protein A2234_04720, partial [Elusimicrobia bacterium RIFOXYA2_FULL_58_8]
MERQAAPGDFFKDAVLLLTNNVLIFGISLVSGVIIARGLGPQGKGVYAIVFLFPSIIAGLGSLGLNYSGMYFLNKNIFPKTEITGNTVLYALFGGTVLTLLIMSFSGAISARFLGGENSACVIAAAPLVPLLLLAENIYHFFLASREIKNISLYNAIRNLSYLLIAAGFYFLSSLSVLKALLAQAAALSAAIFFGLYTLRRHGIFSGISWQWPVFRQMLGFGLRQHIGTAAQFLNYRADMLIAAALLRPYDIGIFSVAVGIAELLWYIANSAAQILYAKTTGSRGTAADNFTPEVARHVFFLTLLAAAALGAAAKPLIGLLFGPSFLPAAGILNFLLPGTVCLGLSKVIGSDISARGFPQYNSTASALSFAVSITLNVLLIPAYGLYGAAAATSISYFINASAMLYFFSR